MEGWVDLGTAVKVRSPCPRLHVAAAVAINTTVGSVIRTGVLPVRRAYHSAAEKSSALCIGIASVVRRAGGVYATVARLSVICLSHPAAARRCCGFAAVSPAATGYRWIAARPAVPSLPALGLWAPASRTRPLARKYLPGFHYSWSLRRLRQNTSSSYCTGICNYLSAAQEQPFTVGLFISPQPVGGPSKRKKIRGPWARAQCAHWLRRPWRPSISSSCAAARRSAANMSSVALSSDVGSSTRTCYVNDLEPFDDVLINDQQWCIQLELELPAYRLVGGDCGWHRRTRYTTSVWLGSRVVCVLDSGAEGPGFKSQPLRCRVTVLGKLFTPIVPLFTKQQNW